MKKGKKICLLSHDKRSGKRDEEGLKNDGSPSSEDSDYVPGDACSSEEDEEAHEILKRFKNFKKKLRSVGVASLDDVELTDNGPKAAETELQSEVYDTPYAESDDEDSVEEIGSDG